MCSTKPSIEVTENSLNLPQSNSIGRKTKKSLRFVNDKDYLKWKTLTKQS